MGAINDFIRELRKEILSERELLRAIGNIITETSCEIVFQVLKDEGYSDEEIEKKLVKIIPILVEKQKELLSTWILASTPNDKNPA